MTPQHRWNDWLTPSFYRVRISLNATDKLGALQAEEQDTIRVMLEEIAEYAAAASEDGPRVWHLGFDRPLLQLRVGRVTLRYAIEEETRTLSVEHVIVSEDDVSLDDVG